jgi:hypothetical protein
MNYHDWLALAVYALVIGVAASACALLARTNTPVSAALALAAVWLGIGVPALILAPALMLYAIKTGAYDAIRDDGATLIDAAALPGRLVSTISIGLAISTALAAIALADTARHSWTKRRRDPRFRPNEGTHTNQGRSMRNS